MVIDFGKYQGKRLELLLFNDPAYIHWMLKEQKPKGPLLKACEAANILIKVFDAKEYVEKCHRNDCDNKAVRFTLCKPELDVPFWWCEKCDPFENGARGKWVGIIGAYIDALKYVERYCNGSKSAYKKIIRDMAKEKGFSDNFTQKNVEIFLN